MNDNDSSPQSHLENSLGSQRNQEPNDLQVAITHMLKFVINKAIENRRSIRAMNSSQEPIYGRSIHSSYDLEVNLSSSAIRALNS